MKHPDDDMLVLFHYGETDDHEALTDHLVVCSPCRVRYQQLTDDLKIIDDMAVPDPGPAYASEVWLRLRPELFRLTTRRRRALWRRGWVRGMALAATVVLAFLLGRFWPADPDPEVVAVGLRLETRQRIFALVVNEHLERSQMLLTDIVNSPSEDKLDLSRDVSWADDLLNQNRIYRAAANQNNDTSLALVLESLERVLLELTHSPDDLSPEDLRFLKRRIAAQDLLFKVRVLRSRVQTQTRPAESTLDL